MHGEKPDTFIVYFKRGENSLAVVETYRNEYPNWIQP